MMTDNGVERLPRNGEHRSMPKCRLRYLVGELHTGGWSDSCIACCGQWTGNAIDPRVRSRTIVQMICTLPRSVRSLWSPTDFH